MKTLYQHNGNNTGFSSFFMFDKEKKWGLVYFTNSKFGDDFGQKLIYGHLMTGWSKGKQITIGLTIIFSIILLLVNLVLLLFKKSKTSKIRKYSLKIALVVFAGTIISLILMLASNIGLGIYIVYGILLSLTIALILRILKMIIEFWKEKRNNEFELTFQILLIFGILFSGIAIGIL